MDNVQTTATRPKQAERLVVWADVLTVAAVLLTLFGVGWGIELVGDAAASEVVGRLGIGLVLFSLGTGVLVCMLAAWARAWAAWATHS